ncbi:hypothetical protein OJF2_02250 [Aquisphaera giovannonii]|uniref:Uncharacterized protein n=1 Tax=Aquisphaera giovannonii TaxID=406548 RepID=A0A5B9VVM1_9BACT|nr:hypothetical protein OJF2_02250 [Aquisphaera giovannonii]
MSPLDAGTLEDSSSDRLPERVILNDEAGSLVLAAARRLG